MPPRPGRAKRFTATLCGAVLLLWQGTSAAHTALVAVATNFAPTLASIVEVFQAHSGHRITLASGASGKIYAQIRHGAPFDAFLSADQAKPAALVKAGLALPDSRFSYALGALVLWSADPERVDARGQVLIRGDFRRLALANPRLAPYGVAALEVLQALDLVETTRARWVLGENIAQTYQFVHSGNAELGLVARAQLWRAGQAAGGSAWPVPASLHAPIRQDAVLLQSGRDNPAARALLDFLRGAQARRIMESQGYTWPGA